MKSKIISIALIFSAPLFKSCDKSEKTILMDATEILSIKKEEVIKHIGEPDSTYYIPMLNKKIFTQLYYKGTYDIEVRYENGLSKSILIQSNNDLPFSKEALKILGITDVGEADHYKPNLVLTWNDKKGFDKINIYSTRLQEDETVEKFKVYVRAK